ncbi:outer membrane receptor for ferrienterochelin and colicins [Fodinibius salinus]|uniref:Outer membrane receptor for ferrienterochelin and colicins n=1 Tax=Fodinibius salinus TaxID=860790 RepID=A0A5D3YKB7_9BACT|nr:TonB-dependent receptor [Fodinibius salinus]TYP92172.1 outer membrane receptor for ferrienterochelin and colicins [Fodinibius salinus]
MIRYSLLLLLSITIPVVAIGQSGGTVKGTIYSNGNPVAGANVIITQLQKGSPSDNDGTFRLSNITPGNYTLLVSAVGYKRYSREITIREGKRINIDIQLKAKTEQLEEVVVTGTMRETYVKESPVKVAVITPQRLQRSKTSSNIMDLISNVNGLSTQLNCGVCGTNAIRINGVEGPNTAVLIDGMPIMGALASVYGLNGISPSVIDQVEVIKGPQSTLYGTQALGGVVNIITKNPDLTPTFSADAYAKSTKEGNINIAASPKVGRFKGFISGNALRMENFFDNNGDNFNDVAKRSRISLFGKGTLEGKNGEQRLNFATKYYNENRTGGVKTFADGMRGSSQIYGESIYTERAELLTDYRPAGLSQQLQISGALTYHNQDSFYGSEHYDAQQNIAFGQATWTQSFSDAFTLLTGVTARYQTYNDNTPATSNGTNKRFIAGGFTQGELSINNIILLAGLRVDHHTQHGIVTAPRLSAKYSPDNYTTIRASAGTGFRIVNVFTEDHAALTGSRQVVFAENLAPEESKSITASVEQIFPLGSNPLTVNIDGFYTRFSNKIIPDYNQNPNLIVYENLNGYSVTQGGSVSLDHNLTVLPFNYNISFTLMDVFTQENGQRQSLTYAPDFTGSWGITYQLPDLNITLGYSGTITGPKRMPDNYVQQFGRDRSSPTYTTHDFKITKEFTNVNSANGVGIEAYISGENILNYTQGSPLVDASNPFGSQFDTIYTWGPVIGRTFSLGARLNIR